jgi:ubiquinone biosynthesis protein
MVGRIDERLREEMEEMLLAVSQRDVRSLTGIIQRLGQLPPNFDESALSIDVDDFVGNYSTMPLKQIDLGSLLSDVTEIIHRHRVQLPPQAALLIKVIVTLEGTLKSLDPQISVIDLLKPVQTKIFLRRLSPARHLRRLRRSLVDLEQLAEILPRRLTSILEQIQTGKFDVHLDHRRLEPSVNRLVLGMLTSALFIGSALMLSQEVPPLLFHDGLKIGGKPVGFGLRDLSLLGLIGCGLSMLIGLRLLRAIGKSGHLDRRD